MAHLIEWDKTGEHRYETGVDRCVLYVYQTGTGIDAGKEYGGTIGGVAWNGITGVTESPSGAEANAMYADNIKYLNLYSAEEFGATIEAYTYPDEFGMCDGSSDLMSGLKIGQQDRKTFGICYRTTMGDDVNGNNGGYKLHFIYGCKASPSEKSYQSINDSPEAITFSWEISTVPVNVTGYKPTACVTVDSNKFATGQAKTNLETLESILYGTKGQSSAQDVKGYMPLPDKILEILSATESEED